MPSSCQIGDCARPAVATVPPMGRLCGTHYQRHRRGRPLEPPLQPRGLARVTLYAPRALLDRLQARAGIEGLTLAEAARRAIAEWLR